MTPIGKALWFIESHFAQDIALDDIAEVAQVSRYHLSRSFGETIGYSITAYLRGRRLSESARALAKGASDILQVALDAGYGSHEAFTRAFREQFGLTPEALRAHGHLDDLMLVEPFDMNTLALSTIEPIRFETAGAKIMAGLSRPCTVATIAAIPAQWQSFAPHIGHVPGQIGGDAYGLHWNFTDDGEFEYMCAVEVRGGDKLPEGFSQAKLAPQRYAVFLHRDHISAIRNTWAAIHNVWRPATSIEPQHAPSFERYDERFDPRTGTGDVEIWIPVKA
ncbi:AraC family transcriptional regulator [Methylovirgula sp. 4M-Z18]|uniref:AraC family transcriptional regulator n=1 Tax=Methylovirgula sp. 4M-Z18 TaxID=2293567 RepID=UPI000E2E9014|nr:AraC family transcriptional regulator [Methylovirgula sp. 4M-Z18]RFB79176.1 AraC family transcriptional regulator [Methylovirgula sp. 4M-Z18]